MGSPTDGQREGRQYIPTLPLAVYRTVCRLGTAGMVFLLVWRQAKVERAATIKLTTALVKRFGFSRKAKDAALKKLEAAGVVSVERRKGKNPLVTVLRLAHP